MKKLAPQSRKNDLVVQELNDEVLIYDLINNKAFCLNETSAIVLELCNGNNSISQISQELSNRLKTSANEELVWLALDQLRKEKLIEIEKDIESPFIGMGRREVIKKVGLGTMVALPIVASMVAPTPAEAATCAGPTDLIFGMICNQHCQCMSNCCSGTCRVSGIAPGMLCLVDCSCVSGNCQPNSMCA